MRDELQSPGRWLASASRTFDRWPPWARVLTGLVLLTAVTVPVARSGEDTTPERSRPEAQVAPSTTTTPAMPTTTAAQPPPPPTVAPVGVVSPGDPRQTAAELLDLTSLSRSVLIDQLQREGFSEIDAAAGVDALDVDWNRQAAEKAAEYLRFRAFDRRGLTEQLLVEGFTPAEVAYGVSTTGL